MIALLFSWVLIAAVFYTFGRAAMQLWALVSKDGDAHSALDVILVGMCATASIIAVFSIWMPANTMLLFALIFACILYWLCNNGSIASVVNGALDFLGGQPKIHLLMYAVLVVSIAMFATLHPVMTDTLYYHYQNIMWNDQYAVVPGLANLQPRFGFNSSYFLLASTFGLKPLFGQYIFGVHTFLLVSIFVWVVYKTIHAKSVVKAVTATLMFVCFFVIYKSHITSVTTDFISNLLIVYLVLKVVFDREAVSKNPVLYFLLPVFIITLKLSCFSVIAFPMYVLWKQVRGGRYRELAVCGVGSLLIVVPWCVRTVILSGYLIFPFPYIDLFSFDWKIPIEYAIEQKEFIQSFARYPNNLDIKAVLAMPISEWFAVWWKSDMFYFNPIANRSFFFLTLIAFPVGIYFFVSNRGKKDYEVMRLIWLASVVGTVVWFFNAPDFRFIYSLILSQVFLVMLQLAERVKFLESKLELLPLRIVLVTITIIFVALFSGRWVHYQRNPETSVASLIRVPASMDYPRTKAGLPTKDYFITVVVNGIEIKRKSQADRDVLCFDCDLPCSADYVGGLEMRGDNIQQGYRSRPGAERRLTY